MVNPAADDVRIGRLVNLFVIATVALQHGLQSLKVVVHACRLRGEREAMMMLYMTSSKK